ncbi:MAG: DNA polymerase III subunit delta [Coriobacteriales bacterium]|jgi:DNA polymerase-3 subunit delta|nr:DNA polymerase III subunit delta [Coriobacteriales bacterium]
MSATEKPLSRLYLFNGDDVLKQDTLLERLRQRVSAEGDLTMNMQVFGAKDIPSANELLNALNTLPFGSPIRLVVIKGADGLSKTLQEALVTYAHNPSATTVLALVAKKLSISSRLYKAIKKYDAQSIINCGAKKRSELPALVRGMARGEGVDITGSAAIQLIERVGTSTIALNTEIGKLAAIAKADGSNRIEDEAVAFNVARLVEPKPWDLTNALALRDLPLCLKLVDRMRGYTAVSLFMQCIAKLREVLTAATLKKRGVPVASSMGKQEWQLKEVIKATALYQSEELIALLQRAPKIETHMKSGADADQLLRVWLVDACTQKTTRAQKDASSPKR